MLRWGMAKKKPPETQPEKPPKRPDPETQMERLADQVEKSGETGADYVAYLRAKGLLKKK